MDNECYFTALLGKFCSRELRVKFSQRAKDVAPGTSTRYCEDSGQLGEGCIGLQPLSGTRDTNRQKSLPLEGLHSTGGYKQ